jgi:hypothetical protein
LVGQQQTTLLQKRCLDFRCWTGKERKKKVELEKNQRVISGFDIEKEMGHKKHPASVV